MRETWNTIVVKLRRFGEVVRSDAQQAFFPAPRPRGVLVPVRSRPERSMPSRSQPTDYSRIQPPSTTQL